MGMERGYFCMVNTQVKSSPRKDARFSKIRNIPDLLSVDEEGKLMENIDFKYFSNRASCMGNP